MGAALTSRDLGDFRVRYFDTLKQLTYEIRNTVNTEAEITIQTTMSLPYLAAVINETLSIHHPTRGNLLRVMSS